MRGPCLPYTLAIIISLLLVLGIAACGGGEDEPVAVVTTPDPTPTAVPTTVAEVTPTEQPATPEAATPSPEATQAIPNEADNLAQHAGGPGATFVGDPMQLVGLPPHEGLMFEASKEQYLQGATASLIGVAPMGIPGHTFIYTSDYYQGLIEKANLTNPTELTSSGESIDIQHTCIDRNLPTCVLIQA